MLIDFVNRIKKVGVYKNVYGCKRIKRLSSWEKLHDLALKMNKNWLFSLETGKHNHYSYFHVAYLYIQCQNQ